MTDHDKTAAAAQKEYAALVDRIRARRDLSPEGLKAHLAQAYNEHKASMQKLREAQADERDERRDSITRQVFRGPGTVCG